MLHRDCEVQAIQARKPFSSRSEAALGDRQRQALEAAQRSFLSSASTSVARDKRRVSCRGVCGCHKMAIPSLGFGSWAINAERTQCIVNARSVKAPQDIVCCRQEHAFGTQYMSADYCLMTWRGHHHMIERPTRLPRIFGNSHKQQ
jgi:hypothetical protein